MATLKALVLNEPPEDYISKLRGKEIENSNSDKELTSVLRGNAERRVKMKISVPDKQNPRIYWPRELTEDGYKGNLKIHEGFSAIVIPRPGAASKDVAKTLELMAQDFKYRAQTEE